MELKFVKEAEIGQRGRKSGDQQLWADFIEELYKHPNKWAEFPKKVAHSSSIYRVIEKFADVHVSIKGGNNLKVDDPKKKLWTIYVQYIPKVADADLF